MPKGDVATVYEDGQWTNVIEGEGPSHLVFEKKDDAIAEGRRLAKDAGVEHIIKNEDGQIAERNSHGHDPRNVPG